MFDEYMTAHNIIQSALLSIHIKACYQTLDGSEL